MDVEAQLEAKYRLVKKKMQELKSLRFAAVRADIEDVREKIAEHQQVHTVAISELVQHNEKLRKKITEGTRGREEVEALRAENADLRRMLAKIEPIIAPFLSPTSGFNVTVVSMGTYNVANGENFVMRLSFLSDKVFCQFLCTPNGMEKCPDCPWIADGALSFELSGVNGFCARLKKGLKFCSLPRR